MNEYQYKQCIKITEKFIHWDMCEAFVEKVRQKDVPDYYDVIQRPMWLNKVLERLKNRSYSKLKSYIDDMNLIWENAIKFNGEESFHGTIASCARCRFQKKIRNITKSPQEDFIKQLKKISKGIQFYTQRFNQEIDHIPSNMAAKSV